jgi:hypothetical protein
LFSFGQLAQIYEYFFLQNKGKILIQSKIEVQNHALKKIDTHNIKFGITASIIHQKHIKFDFIVIFFDRPDLLSCFVYEFIYFDEIIILKNNQLLYF